MTPGPTDGKCANPAGGPGGMPLALKLNEGLGVLVPERDIADYEYGDDDWLDDEPTCDRCRGDTMDPWCEYLLPCPAFQGGRSHDPCRAH